MTQDQALDILKSGANVFLTGEPGAGKTHTINRYVAYLREHDLEPALTASTGIAATHISGMTIHSWSGIGVRGRLTPYELDMIVGNERVHKRIAKAKVLIIDEVSMLEARMLDMVEAVCRTVRRSYLPFGGLQVVLVGDFYQLPPITREDRPVEFVYRSDAWAKLDPSVCYLTDQYRQDDPEFLEVLTAIRAGAVDARHIAILERRSCTPEEADPDLVNLFPRNMDVDRINERELLKIEGESRGFTMETRGTPYMIESLQRSCLSPAELKLKIGAAVMFTRNNPQNGFVNGTLGTVTDFGPGGFPVVRTRHDATITAEPMEWKVEDQGKVLAALKQVPLRLAWAMTIHKSQGLSLDAAVMDLRTAFEYGQGYVALSRVRRLSGLYLLGCNQKALMVHPDALSQDKQFRAESDYAGVGIAKYAPEELLEIQNAFVLACGGKLEVEKKAKKGKAKKDDGLTDEQRAARAARYVEFIAKQREASPNAYVKWSKEEEEKLTALFRAQLPIKEIATQLSRKDGGIRSRLKKLGLME